mgnify:CR=1 FL=1|jgi:hypothetical protein
MIQLDHFYYGQLVHHGAPAGERRVLARSRGVTDEQIQVALAVQPAALQGGEGVSWGFLRGARELPYFLVHSQAMPQGHTLWHYILLNAELPRVLQGNFRAYLPLIVEPLPTFEMLADTLPPLTLNEAAALPQEAQADDLLELMSLTGNNTRNIEPLLSSVVSGRTLVVRAAPADARQRLALVQGLVTLLPSSTRFGVTFLLHAEKADVGAQIVFCEAEADERFAVYDWQNAETANAPSNDYSRFIVSQLRLDTGVAVQQAEALTHTAGWRFRGGDKLADALAYASQRSRVDQAVRSNLPVSAEEVSRILSDDPTLDEDLRLLYGQHLVSFALALDDTAHTDPVAVLCANNPGFARSVLGQLRAAMENGKASVVFRMLSGWLVNPLAPQAPEWIDLLNKSALLELRDIVSARDVESLKLYLQDIQSFPERGLIQRILPKVIEVSVPLASEDADLPSQIMLLGMSALDRQAFQKLLAVPALARYLPRDIKRFLAALGNPVASVPPGLLLQAADAMGAGSRDEAIMQFAEMACNAERLTLIDTAVLGEMARIGTTPLGMAHVDTLLKVARAVNDLIPPLKEPAPRYILQLFIASHRYDLLLKSMAEQSRDLYGGERQADYVKMLQEVFAATPIPLADMRTMLTAIRDHGIREVPYICVICGVLEASGYHPELAEYAEYAMRELAGSPEFADVIHYEAPLALLRYFVEIRQGAGVNQMAQLMPRVAASKEDKESLLGIRETHKTLMQHERLHGLAFEVLRQYVRLASQKAGQRIVEYYTKELGREQGAKLRHAYDFSLFTNRLSIEEYAVSVKVAADLLANSLSAYAREKPTHAQIQSHYENIRVRVDAISREKLGAEIMNFARSIAALARQESKPPGQEMLNALLRGQENPRTILDIFRVAGGKLLRGRGITTRLGAPAAATPFGEVPPQQLYGDLMIAVAVLRQPLLVYPPGKPIAWTAALISEELESIFRMMPADRAQIISRQLGADWLRLATLIPLLMRDAEPTILEPDNKTGKRLDNQSAVPRNPMEFYRYMAGLLA